MYASKIIFLVAFLALRPAGTDWSHLHHGTLAFSRKSRLYIKFFLSIVSLKLCPGFSWDRVNYHKKLIGLTQTANQKGYSIPCGVMFSI